VTTRANLDQGQVLLPEHRFPRTRSPSCHRDRRPMLGEPRRRIQSLKGWLPPTERVSAPMITLPRLSRPAADTLPSATQEPALSVPASQRLPRPTPPTTRTSSGQAHSHRTTRAHARPPHHRRSHLATRSRWRPTSYAADVSCRTSGPANGSPTPAHAGRRVRTAIAPGDVLDQPCRMPSVLSSGISSVHG
jgi:hypothetical protein